MSNTVPDIELLGRLSHGKGIRIGLVLAADIENRVIQKQYEFLRLTSYEPSASVVYRAVMRLGLDELDRQMKAAQVQPQPKEETLSLAEMLAQATDGAD